MLLLYPTSRPDNPAPSVAAFLAKDASRLQTFVHQARLSGKLIRGLRGTNMTLPISAVRLAAICLLLGLSQTVLAATREDEVRAVLARNAEGWDKFDADEIAGTYASDATWQNPFGVRLEGPQQIKAFLVRLFARPGFRVAKDTAPLTIQKISFLGSRAAVVWSEESSTGQTENGKPVGDRHSHYLQVLHRTPSGWRITDEMIMDERE
jgi:uncharacterized protein (TIGR02246 family)